MAATTVGANRAFFNQLRKYYTWYTGGFLVFLVVLAIAEQLGLSRQYIGYAFLFATIALYAGIGIMSRTADVAEYYVAGRRVPALFNGMATGADWMSAASFIGMAGTLYLSGYDGLSFVMGWTGGYCLVAFLLAPYLRKFGQFTIPDFLGARYGGNIVRSIGIIAAIICSFVYVVAQIYGVGLITSRFTGLAFEIGVFVGLGGILVCSMLGGMRAVTWTQVAQYIILIIAYLTPVVWLGVRHTGVPIPQFAYGQTMQKLAEVEKKIFADPREADVAQDLQRARGCRRRCGKGRRESACRSPSAARKRTGRSAGSQRTRRRESTRCRSTLTEYPTDAADVEGVGRQGQGTRRARRPTAAARQPYPGKDEAARDTARLNFIGIVFCMMFGTAALPHILMRYYTTPSVQQARDSVFWSLFFIFLLYFTAPCLAVLAKYDVYTNLVGSSFAALPAWACAVGIGRSHSVEHHRHQSRRDRAARRDRHRRRFDRAGHTGDRRVALCCLGVGGRGWSGSGTVDCGRVAADDRQRVVTRSVLQDDRSVGFDQVPRDAFQGAARGRCDFGSHRDVAEAGRYFVPGRRGVLAGGFGVLPAARDGYLLEARHQVGSDHRHARRTGGLHLLHACAPTRSSRTWVCRRWICGSD